MAMTVVTDLKTVKQLATTCTLIIVQVDCEIRFFFIIHYKQHQVLLRKVYCA